MTDYFEIGKIVNTVGIGGEIKIYPTTDDLKRFDLLNEIRIILRDDVFEKRIERVRYHKNLVMMKLAGVDDVSTADGLRGGVIVVERASALPLADNEYYLKDLVGLTVAERDGNVLGVLADVIFTGANDVYVVKRGGDKDLLIPAIAECILDVDLKDKLMVVHLLEGLEA